MNISPAKRILESEKSSEKINTAKAESDYLQRKLLEKKNQIEILEPQIQPLYELSSLLKQIICDFQQTGELKFDDDFDQNQDLDPKNAISIIQGGLNNLIDYHEKLRSRYELEFVRNLFELNQKLDSKKVELAAEESLLMEEQQELLHKQKIIEKIINEKKIIEQTILLKKSSLLRHKESNARNISQINEQLNNAIQKQNWEESILVGEEVEIRSKEAKIAERKASFAQHMQDHNEATMRVSQLRREYKKESHQHNITRSELDQSKEKLFSLSKTIESYHNNLKTQELYGTEIYNQRLRAIIDIENM